MKICYIGHSKHISTKSTDFLIRELKTRATTLDTFAIDESNYQSIKKLYDSNYDLIICFQYDFIAPSFIMRNFPTVIIPMYDGSGGHGSFHWNLFKDSRILNFSHELHSKCINLNLDSLYIKYHSNPKLYKKAEFDSGLKGFFWQRRPDFISWRNIIDKINIDSFKSFHIHDSADLKYHYKKTPHKNILEKNNITVSTWFEQKEDFDKTLNNSNVFFASRINEGIGQSFIEAMNRGMLVIASDLPTHSEYIANDLTGMLIDWQNNLKEKKLTINLNTARMLGQRARENCIYGYNKYMEKKDQMVNFILSAKSSSKSYTSQKIQSADMLAKVFFENQNYSQYVRKNFYSLKERLNLQHITKKASNKMYNILKKIL